MNNLPSFFNYSEEGRDSGYEAIQDFFLSWTLRCSKESYKQDNFLINLYARKVVYSLIFGENSDLTFNVDFNEIDSFDILDIKTKRQFRGIDLLVEIEVRLNNAIRYFILNIENKWYTTVRENQLLDYVRVIKENFNLRVKTLVNLVIYCDESTIMGNPTQAELCRLHGYKFTNIAELASITGIYKLGRTGNKLFDEYWFDL